jgi:DNA-binding transcriptional regulator LsrR (DeoR family)
MPTPRDVDSLVKVARMYFQDGVSQQDIAHAMGTSRSNVSRMLTAAREQRIVEIRINDPVGRDTELEAALQARFGLSDVRVAAFRPGVSALQQVAELASWWLLDILRDGQRVALSWGSSLQAMVWSTTAVHPYHVDVVQLVGGLSPVKSQVTGQELVRELAARLGATYRYLHAPALLQSAEAAQALMNERSIKDALDAARHSDVAVVGVGAVGTGSSLALVESLQLSEEERAEFESQHPVGDICARFFDQAGRAIRGSVYDRVLAVDLEDLREIPTLAGVVAGAEKAPGVLGALRGQLLDCLICDGAVARGVLRPDASM